MDNNEHDHDETLLKALRAPLPTFEALAKRCHRALSAHVWSTCRWGDDYRIGEYEFLVVEFGPQEGACLYLQFWSEPEEEVLVEVASGEWSPDAVRFIGPSQRQALQARGYAKGGEAKNFRKTLTIDSPEPAEAAALEALEVIWHVLGYRGLSDLQVTRERNERAEIERVHTSVTPQDFAKVAMREGWATHVLKQDEERVVALKRGRRVSYAFFDWKQDENLFAAIALQTEVTSKVPIPDETIGLINRELRFVAAWRVDRRTLRIRMPLHLDGGVTAEWLEQALAHWIGSVRECERRLRRQRTTVNRTRVAGPTLLQ